MKPTQPKLTVKEMADKIRARIAELPPRLETPEARRAAHNALREEIKARFGLEGAHTVLKTPQPSPFVSKLPGRHTSRVMEALQRAAESDKQKAGSKEPLKK